MAELSESSKKILAAKFSGEGEDDCERWGILIIGFSFCFSGFEWLDGNPTFLLNFFMVY